MNAPTNGFAQRGALYVPTFDLERDVHAEPVNAQAAGSTLPADLRESEPTEGHSPTTETKLTPPDLGESPAPVDGNTEKVRELKARVAEADRIRALPTDKVLARQQALAESEQLARLDTTDHARRLHIAGERQRAELAAKAVSAAGKRRLQADVDVRALTLSRRRRSRTLILWAVLGAAMAYTAVNVQKFAAGHALPWSAQWTVAWLVDPLLSGLVVALLLTRGDLAVFGKPAHEGRWDRIVVPLVEIGALVAALLMNVSPEIQAHSPWESVVLHIVVPLAAVAAALALPVVQRRYAVGIAALYESAGDVSEDPQVSSTTNLPEVRYGEAFVDVHDTVHDFDNERLVETPPERVHGRPSRTPRKRTRKTRKRTPLADYVAAARERLTPDVTVTPAWVMSTVGCARGTAYKVAALLSIEHAPLAEGTDR